METVIFKKERISKSENGKPELIILEESGNRKTLETLIFKKERISKSELKTGNQNYFLERCNKREDMCIQGVCEFFNNQFKKACT